MGARDAIRGVSTFFLVWLHLPESRGFSITQRDFADAWLKHIHYMWDGGTHLEYDRHP